MIKTFSNHSFIIAKQQPQQPMQQSPEGTESECASDPIDRPPSVSSQVFILCAQYIHKTSINHIHKHTQFI
jgi:hypothetical protein